MASLAELLEPIGADDPAGPDLSATNEYSEIERAYREADVPPVLSPTGVEEQPDFSFAEVADLARDFLGSRSKDLKVAALLTAALLREEGFAGLASGLELLRGLMERYWDALHPDPAGGAAVLEWLGSENVSFAVYLVPLTGMGHTYFHYKEWLKEQAEEEGKKRPKEQPGSGGSNEISGANFDQGFAETSWEWYNGLRTSLEGASIALKELEEYGREKFPEVDVRPPSYRDLSDALKRVASGVQELFGRKPRPAGAVSAAAPPGQTRSEPDPEAAGSPEAESPGGAGAAPATTPGTPRSPDEAAAAVTTAARVLRRADPSSPVPYLLLRGLRWGELRAGGEHPDPRILVAPDPSQRTRLKSLFLDQTWSELLEAVEEVMATPAGRGWLDLQRYAVLAAERLGADYRHVADALRGALAGLLADVPDLARATLMDDSATASRDTVTWLESQGLIGADEEREADPGTDTDAGRLLREASFQRAADLARAGDPQGAIELLMERARHESSERARFIIRAEAARIMVQHGMKPVARPILDDLFKRIEEHKLEAWEPSEVVAKPLGLLIRCLDPSDGAQKSQLYHRLARLDPLLASRVNEDGGADETARPAAAAAGAEEADG